MRLWLLEQAQHFQQLAQRFIVLMAKRSQLARHQSAATPTTDAVTGSAFTALTASKGSVFVFCYDGTSTTAATAIKVVQGSVESLTGEADGNNASFVSGPEFLQSLILNAIWDML